MTTQIFSNQINSLNNQIKLLHEQLSIKQQELETLQTNEQSAQQVINQLSDLINQLQNTQGADNLKKTVLDLFDNNDNIVSNPETKNNSTTTEIEEDNTSIKQQSAIELTEEETVEQETAEQIINTTPEITKKKDEGYWMKDEIISDEMPSSSFSPQPSSLPQDSGLSQKDFKPEEDKYNPYARQLTTNIYKSNSGQIIIGFTAIQRAKLWGEWFKHRAKICSQFSLQSGKRRLTDWKHELCLTGVKEQDLQQLTKNNFDFRKSPEKAYSQAGVKIPPVPEPEPAYTKESSLKIEEIEVGDLVQTNNGEYEVLEIKPSYDPRHQHLISGKCLRHKSFPPLVGQNFDFPAEGLSLVKKGVSPKSDVEFSQELENNLTSNYSLTEEENPELTEVEEPSFVVGETVEILSARQGEEFVNQIGEITNVGSMGCAVLIGKEIRFYFPEEIKVVQLAA